LQRPGEAYAVWRLCQEDGSVASWYINLQDPVRIHDDCVDTLDHELDVVVTPNGQRWYIKDAEQVDVSARQGRFDRSQADRIRRQADQIVASLRSGHRWWEGWLDWNPEPTWLAPDGLPPGWDS
jgi:predicted RNA-binding protein associated with RNAse of E/G family